MNPLDRVDSDDRNPMESGWIALAPVHLVPWILLMAGFLQDLLFAALPYGFHPRMLVGWGFTLFRWALGGLALAAAFQARPKALPGTLRQTALGLATTVLGLRICLALAMPFIHRLGMHFYPAWTLSHAILTLISFSALILLLAERKEEPGGPFDGAIAALLIAGGLGWIGLPVLAIAAMKGHPLLAAQWQALRDPRTALEGGWFDGLDGALRLKNLGACALTCALAFLALIGRLVLTFSHGSPFASSAGWTSAELAAVVFASLLLAVHVIRQSRLMEGRPGRGLAIAALIVAGLPLLLLFAGLVLLVLILTDVIHFRLF